jgi:nucleolar protein 14
VSVLYPCLTYTLQVLAGVLVDHMLHVASLPNPQLSVVSGLLPHLRALTKAYPRQTAEHFTGKLVLMHKNLKRGLNRGAAEDDAKTWPGLPELVFLRILGALWPTSDMRHVVVSPARLLMGSYLGLCKIRSFVDAASGLFLCTLFLQYENRSKRLVPEAINFLIDVIRCLSLPRRGDTTGSARCTSLSRRHEFGQLCIINTGGARSMSVNQPHLVTVIGGKENCVQTNVDLLGLALNLLARFSELYKGLEGFIELYEPVLQTLHDIDFDFLSPMLQVRIQFISVCVPALNSIQGPDNSSYRLYPETLRVFASDSPAFKPSSTQAYPNSIVQSEIREHLLKLSPRARPRP